MKVRLNNVRLSFPQLWEAKEFTTGDGKPRYGCSLLIRKDDEENISKVETAIDEAGRQKWPKKWNPRSVKMHAFRDGDDVSYDGYADCMFVSANRPEKSGRPKIIDRNKQDLMPADGRPYAGCYVNAVVEFYGDDRYGKAMNCGLIGIQFLRDGEAFSGGSSYSDDDFDELEEPGWEDGETADDDMMG